MAINHSAHQSWVQETRQASKECWTQQELAFIKAQSQGWQAWYGWHVGLAGSIAPCWRWKNSLTTSTCGTASCPKTSLQPVMDVGRPFGWTCPSECKHWELIHIRQDDGCREFGHTCADLHSDLAEYPMDLKLHHHHQVLWIIRKERQCLHMMYAMQRQHEHTTMQIVAMSWYMASDDAKHQHASLTYVWLKLSVHHTAIKTKRNFSKRLKRRRMESTWRLVRNKAGTLLHLSILWTEWQERRWRQQKMSCGSPRIQMETWIVQ